MPAASPTTTIEGLDATYCTLSLTGLETVMFNSVSGLTHSVNLTPMQQVTSGGNLSKYKVVDPVPVPSTLSLNHVVLSDMTVFSWMDAAILALNGPSEKKAGTLSIVNWATGTAVKSWTLADVMLTGLTLSEMGINGGSTLTASLTLFCGTCTPQ